MAFVPTIDRGRETALPCPLYYSGAAGIDISKNFPFLPQPSNFKTQISNLKSPNAQFNKSSSATTGIHTPSLQSPSREGLSANTPLVAAI